MAVGNFAKALTRAELLRNFQPKTATWPDLG